MSSNRAEIELASQGASSHVPFADIRRRQSSYIAPEYMPAGITIRDPRNMSLQDVKEFLTNVAERQQNMTLPKVFRFKKVATSRKANGTLTPAIYPGDMEEAAAEQLREQKEKEKRRRAPRKKGKRSAARPGIITTDDLDGLISMPVRWHLLRIYM